MVGGEGIEWKKGGLGCLRAQEWILLGKGQSYEGRGWATKPITNNKAVNTNETAIIPTPKRDGHFNLNRGLFFRIRQTKGRGRHTQQVDGWEHGMAYKLLFLVPLPVSLPMGQVEGRWSFVIEGFRIFLDRSISTYIRVKVRCDFQGLPIVSEAVPQCRPSRRRQRGGDERT